MRVVKPIILASLISLSFLIGYYQGNKSFLRGYEYYILENFLHDLQDANLTIEYLHSRNYEIIESRSRAERMVNLKRAELYFSEGSEAFKSDIERSIQNMLKEYEKYDESPEESLRILYEHLKELPPAENKES